MNFAATSALTHRYNERGGIAELFQIGLGTVNHHLKAIYVEEELAPEATIRRHRIVQTEGSDRRATQEDLA